MEWPTTSAGRTPVARASASVVSRSWSRTASSRVFNPQKGSSAEASLETGADNASVDCTSIGPSSPSGPITISSAASASRVAALFARCGT